MVVVTVGLMVSLLSLCLSLSPLRCSLCLPPLPHPATASIHQANCIDSTVDAATVFAREVKKMQEEKIKPQEQLTLEPYERDHALVVGVYRPAKKAKTA